MISPGGSGPAKFELAISYLLVIGVITSLILVGVGMILFYIHFGQLEISEKESMFLRKQNFFYFFLDLLRGGQGQDKATWLMTLGIAILILTPYARVIMSVLHFIRKRDLKYTHINLSVFILITVSFIPVQISGKSIIAPLMLLINLKNYGIFENQVPQGVF